MNTNLNYTTFLGLLSSQAHSCRSPRSPTSSQLPKPRINFKPPQAPLRPHQALDLSPLSLSHLDTHRDSLSLHPPSALATCLGTPTQSVSAWCHPQMEQITDLVLSHSEILKAWKPDNLGVAQDTKKGTINRYSRTRGTNQDALGCTRPHPVVATAWI